MRITALYEVRSAEELSHALEKMHTCSLVKVALVCKCGELRTTEQIEGGNLADLELFFSDHCEHDKAGSA